MSWSRRVRQFYQASLRQLLATFPTRTSAFRGRRSSEDSEMSIHAACLLLWREILYALAKPTELLGRLLPRWARALVNVLFFGWQRTITLRRCRTDILLTSIERDGMRQGFDLLLIHSVLRLGPSQPARLVKASQ